MFIRGIKPEQVHLAFVDITTIGGDNSGAQGTNIPLQRKSVRVVEGGYRRVEDKFMMIVDYVDACTGKFVPRR